MGSGAAWFFDWRLLNNFFAYASMLSLME